MEKKINSVPVDLNVFNFTRKREKLVDFPLTC